MKSVYCAVRTGSLNKAVLRFVFKGLKSLSGYLSTKEMISLLSHHSFERCIQLFAFINYFHEYCKFWFHGARAPQWARASSLSKLHAHTHVDTPHSVRFLWTSERPDAETSTWQHTTLTTDRHPCPRRDSNPQSQKDSGRRPTPYTARPPDSAGVLQYAYK